MCAPEREMQKICAKPRQWHDESMNVTSHQGFGPAVPVLRIHDATIAKAFYLDYLSFAIEWEHCFEPELPLYLRIHRGRTFLDLSEHHGDGVPGTVVWVPIGNVEALEAELAARADMGIRPGTDQDAPGGPTLEVTDPFGNVLRFCEAVHWPK